MKNQVLEPVLSFQYGGERQLADHPDAIGGIIGSGMEGGKDTGGEQRAQQAAAKGWMDHEFLPTSFLARITPGKPKLPEAWNAVNSQGRKLHSEGAMDTLYRICSALVLTATGLRVGSSSSPMPGLGPPSIQKTAKWGCASPDSAGADGV